MGADIKDGWVEVGGLRIHYLEAGKTNAPVLLLHGGGYDSGSLSYGLSIGPISQRHKAFAPDWPGYGHSDKPKATYSTGYFMDFLGQLMEVLGLSKASLVGVSMGGAISLGFSLRSPERVDKLVLVGSHGLGGEVPWRTISYAMVRLPLLNKALWATMGRSRRMIRWSLRAVFYDPRNVTEGLVDQVYRLTKKPEAARAWRSWQRNEIHWSGFRTNFVDSLQEVEIPTLILHGAEDRFVPVAWARRAHELIVDSELHVFPECGHWLPREKPEEFERAVLTFLARRRQ
jgi:pimeloyl-ACP methyl ester carboxylesterase